ncbi:MAG: hypothetical protein ACI8ZM_000926 [Crocinitomix sp.]|jgi:hypothetical protein
MKLNDRIKSIKSNTTFKVRIILTILALNLCLDGFSQDKTNERNEYILAKNSFSIALVSGFNKTEFTAITGETIKSGLGITPKLNIEYRFKVRERFGINVGATACFFPFAYNVEADDPFQGSSEYGYFGRLEYHPYASLYTSLDYNYWFSNRWGFMYSAGGGLHSISSGLYQIGASTFGIGLEYEFTYEYVEDLKPFVFLKAGVNRVLKNDNLLNLSLSYEYVSPDMYGGIYRLYNGQSTGTLINRGNSLNISVGYTFTRAKKFKGIDDFFVDPDEVETYESVKEERKVQSRKIDSETIFVGLSSGLYFGRNQTGFGDHFLNAKSAAGFIFGAEMEKGLSGNQFIQFGLDIAETYQLISVNRPGLGGYYTTSNFVGVQISAGIGTRLISKKSKINFLNISAGLSIGINNMSLGDIGSSGNFYLTPDGTDTLRKFTIQYTGKSKIYPTLYANLSRDFHLTHGLFLSIDYRFNLGLISTIQGDVEYQEQPNFDQVLTDRIDIKGTANAFQIGLKYKFIPKKKSE